MIVAKAKKLSNKFYQFPIHMVIESGSEECVDALADDLKINYPKFGPIHSASRSGNRRLF